MDALIAHFGVMARYNRVANQKLYAAAAELSEDAFIKPRPAFFGSIRGTLNHIMVGDRIWLGRFEGKVTSSDNLGALLYESFDALFEARLAEDDRIDAMAADLTPAFLESDIRYVNNEGRDIADPAAVAVAHFFNHQTHHRGQVHDMLSQTAVPPPSLDMHRCINP